MNDKYKTYKLYRTIQNMSFKLSREDFVDWIYKNYSINRIHKGTGICSVNTCTREKYEEYGEVSEFCLKHIITPPKK